MHAVAKSCLHLAVYTYHRSVLPAICPIERHQTPSFVNRTISNRKNTTRSVPTNVEPNVYTFSNWSRQHIVARQFSLGVGMIG